MLQEQTYLCERFEIGSSI
ncbi:hypothetical protein BDFB_009727 [Asbolus verrucosus]|uniref:Uncharacterized protein n=1 Tax=Asbolus verrucosus TaxID=1661398 RepID=A0A482VN18_ASBVE|nr:hypothetical protein BDFB_009727 [Asbolus verrucosus]